MLSTCKYWTIIGSIWLVGAAWAQTPTPVPNPYATPSPGFAPVPETPPAFAPPADDDSYFVPVQPAPGFDYFSDEDEPGSASPFGGSGGSKHEVKDSFKLLERSTTASCRSWGNSLLGTKTYPDKPACEGELDERVDAGNSAIEDTYDKIERFKLRKVIKGELKSRSEATKYEVNFNSLKGALEAAAKQGCMCKDR